MQHLKKMHGTGYAGYVNLLTCCHLTSESVSPIYKQALSG